MVLLLVLMVILIMVLVTLLSECSLSAGGAAYFFDQPTKSKTIKLSDLKLGM